MSTTSKKKMSISVPSSQVSVPSVKKNLSYSATNVVAVVGLNWSLFIVQNVDMRIALVSIAVVGSSNYFVWHVSQTP